MYVLANAIMPTLTWSISPDSEWVCLWSEWCTWLELGIREL